MISSFSYKFIENLIVNAIDGDGNIVSGGDITLIGDLFGTQTNQGDANGRTSFLVLDSQELTLIATDPVTQLTSSIIFDYTYREDLTLQQIQIKLPECGYAFFNSIFKDFFFCNDLEVLAWCDNVYAKLEGEGILPKYLERTEDFEIFWKAVASMFAFIVKFARVFKDFTSYEDMANTYLDSRGIIYNPQDTLEQKVYLINNYYKELLLRGTNRIYSKSSDNQTLVNGELLRNISYDEDDEFIFNMHFPHTMGWSIENSSPLYKGLSNQIGVNKAYESTKDFVDITKYPTFGNGTQAIITDGNREVFSILNVPNTEIAGIGADDSDFAINVDPNLDYEITFFVRQPIAEANLTFGLREYDRDGLLINTLQRIDTLATESNFFENIQLAKTTNYYFVRGILYNQNATSANVEVDNIGGVNLRMRSGTGKIIPYIELDNTSGGDATNEIRIWDLKVRILSTPYSNGFINPKNFISLWLKNNNATYSENQLEENMRRYLLPYNSSFKVNYL